MVIARRRVAGTIMLRVIWTAIVVRAYAIMENAHILLLENVQKVFIVPIRLNGHLAIVMTAVAVVTIIAPVFRAV